MKFRVNVSTRLLAVTQVIEDPSSAISAIDYIVKTYKIEEKDITQITVFEEKS